MSEESQIKQSKINFKKIGLPLLVGFVVMMFSYLTSLAYTLLMKDTIYEGVFVLSVDASGMTKDELKKALIEKYGKDPISKTLRLKADLDPADPEYTSQDLSFKQAKVTIHFDDAVNKAYDFGRNGNLLTRFFDVTSIAKTEIPLSVSYDQQVVKNTLTALSKKLNLPVQEHQIVISSTTKAAFITGNMSRNLNIEKAMQQVDTHIKNLRDDPLSLSIENIYPKELSLEELYQKIAMEPKNASVQVVNNKIKIASHEYGRKIDKAVLGNILSQSKGLQNKEFLLPVTFIEPQMKTWDLEAKLFQDSLAYFSTQFYTGDKNNDNRKENIIIAAGKINGTIVAPDKNFSFNEVVGPRTPENGYKDAHAYIGGQIVDSTGGGICQVSSTLYNAVLLADFGVLERHNHMFTVGYVPRGRDAAVAYGAADFVFKNTGKWPIKVNCWVSADNKIHFNLMGTNEIQGKKVEFRHVQLKELPPTVENTYDPNLEDGITTLLNEGMMGYIVETYKIVKQNGKVISETKLHTSHYQPYPKQVKIGTKKQIAAGSSLLPTVPSPTAKPKIIKGIDDSYNPPATQ